MDFSATPLSNDQLYSDLIGFLKARVPFTRNARIDALLCIDVDDNHRPQIISLRETWDQYTPLLSGENEGTVCAIKIEPVAPEPRVIIESDVVEPPVPSDVDIGVLSSLDLTMAGNVSKSFHCGVCNKSFPREFHLLRHQESNAHRNLVTSLAEPQQSAVIDSPPSVDKPLPNSTGTSSSLPGKSRKTKRRNQSFAPHRCRLCDRLILYRNNLARHLRKVHDMEKADLLKYTYSMPRAPRKTTLAATRNIRISASRKTHMAASRSSGNRKRHTCNFCHRSFVSGQALASHRRAEMFHQRKRLNPSLHFCCYCPKGFSHLAALLQHKSQDHRNISGLKPLNTSQSVSGVDHDSPSSVSLTEPDDLVKIENIDPDNQVASGSSKCSLISLLPGSKQVANDVASPEKAAKCTLCPKLFSNVLNVERHLRRYHLLSSAQLMKWRLENRPDYQANSTSRRGTALSVRAKRFSCNVCRRSFLTSDILMKHKKLIHKIPQPLRSFRRSERMTTKESTTRSQTAHKHKCPQCNREFAWQASVYKHMTTQHQMAFNMKNSPCQECTVCSLCGKEFHWKTYGLATHLSLAHDKPSAVESRHDRNKSLTASGSSKSNLDGEPTELSSSCDICGNSFSNSVTLRRHRMVLHGVQKNGEIAGRQRHKCSFCQKIFAAEFYLLSHLRSRHGLVDLKYRKSLTKDTVVDEDEPFLEPKVDSPNVSQTEFLQDDSKLNCNVLKPTVDSPNPNVSQTEFLQDDSKLNCNVCHKTFTRSGSCRRHTRDAHSAKSVGSEDLPFPCGVCDRAFSNKQSLSAHMTFSHTDRRLYKCGYCNWRNFTSMKTVFEHRRKHHRGLYNGIAEKLKCGYCDVMKSCSIRLYQHERKHTGEKPFSCDFCDHRCTRRDNLLRHTQIHLNEEPLRCQYCNDPFYDSESLWMHNLLHLKVDLTKTKTGAFGQSILAEKDISPVGSGLKGGGLEAFRMQEIEQHVMDATVELLAGLVGKGEASI